MKLKEFEGKEVLQESGVRIPKGVVVRTGDELPSILPAVVKAQVLSGGRGKANLVRFVQSKEELQKVVTELLASSHNGEQIEELLIEEWIDIVQEHYISIGFSTQTRSPVLLMSQKGGVDVEELRKSHAMHTFAINPLVGITDEFAATAAAHAGLPQTAAIIPKLYAAFERYQAKLVEINPLAIINGECIALDAKIIIDDDGLKAIPRQFPKRTGGRAATPREIAARAIDETDYRGVAGRSFLELDGDIAVLASGGGASLSCMDALLSYGGKPANYVEYSGNPSQEKVKQLTLVTLGKENLAACWVVGGTANFTRIDDTMRGFIEALAEIQPTYPIIVRRAGPGDVEAFAMLKDAAAQHGWSMHVYGEQMPVTESAKVVVELANAYRQSRKQ